MKTFLQGFVEGFKEALAEWLGGSEYASQDKDALKDRVSALEALRIKTRSFGSDELKAIQEMINRNHEENPPSLSLGSPGSRARMLESLKSSNDILRKQNKILEQVLLEVIGVVSNCPSSESEGGIADIVETLEHASCQPLWPEHLKLTEE